MELSNQYIAGLFDGEGSICITKRTQPTYRLGYGFTLDVAICMRDLNILKNLQERYGGSLIKKKWVKYQKSNAYYWRLSNNKALSFLKEIGPLLIIKGEQASVAVSFQETKKTTSIVNQEAYQLRMKFLNSPEAYNVSNL